MNKIIAFGNDHAGYNMRDYLLHVLKEEGWLIRDYGIEREESVDYPDIAKKVAETVAEGKAHYGLLICGSGVGMSIAANKIHGIRAALCTDLYSAEMSRSHNNANILVLRGREQSSQLNVEILRKWLNTPFLAERHQRRIDKIKEMED